MHTTVLTEVRTHLEWNWLSMELAVTIRSVDSRDQTRPIKLGTAASSLKALFCSKNAINSRLLFQTFVWWKDLLHTNADSLGLTESQSFQASVTLLYGNRNQGARQLIIVHPHTGKLQG